MKNTTALNPALLEWSFADRLRKVRREVADATQEEFAAALEVPLKAYGAWEAGRNMPREIVAIAKRIELVTGVPAGWMLGITNVVVPAVTGTEGAVSTGVSGRCPRTNSRMISTFALLKRPRRGYHSRTAAIKRGVRPADRRPGHPNAAPVA